jgi:hypothetical protein
MKRFLLALAVAAVLYYGLTRDETPAPPPPGTAVTVAAHDEPIADAYENRRRDLPVTGQGTVVKLLPDDADGSRHQRFILRLDSGQTLLVAHNVDLAPRIDDLRPGDPVSFHGEYEWNAEGGVIHWTHRDPRGNHEAGWIRHRGRIYQ